MQERKVAEQNETERLYYTDSHMKVFTATVLSCEPCTPMQGQEPEICWKIVLDRTAFFPEGGGQYGDSGMIGTSRVGDTREKDGVIYHYACEPQEPGTQVTCILDWEERFSCMQQHSGEHIVSGLIHEMKGYDNVGFHLGPVITTLDFNGPLTDEELMLIELRANRAVAENFEVEVTFPTKEEEKSLDYRSKLDIEGQVRIVTYPGYDVCACCAPHVNRTGEIGLIKITDAINYKGGTRVTIRCGLRALRDYDEKQKQVKALTSLFSVPQELIADSAEKLKAQSEERRENAIFWQKKYLSGLIEPEKKLNVIFEGELDKNVAREFVNDAVAAGAVIGGAFTGNDEKGYSYVLGSGRVDLRALSKEMNTAFGGKGGGKAEMVQGSVTAGRAALLEFLRSKTE